MSARVLDFGYQPFGAQIAAHKSTSDVVLLAGGWGAGKTFWLLAEMLRNAAMNPGLPGVIVSPTFPIQRKTIYRTIVELFPEATRWPEGRDSARDCLGPTVRAWSAQDRRLLLWNGAEVFFASAEDPGSLEGANYAWACLDEPRLVRHEAWRILNARVRHPGSAKHRVSVAGVPTMGWMFDEFGRNLPNRALFRASTADNPHLPPGFVDRMNLSGRRAQAYLHGHFVHLEGTVFETYQPGATDGDRGSLLPVLPKPERRTFGALDVGFRRPAFVILQDVPVEGGGFVEVVVEEVVVADTMERVHAERCADACDKWGIKMEECYVDPAGDQANSALGRSAIDVYEEVFLRRGVLLARGLQWTLAPVERYIPNGVEAVRARFLDHQDRRRLFVATRLSETETTDAYPEAPAGIHRSLLGLHYPSGKKGRSDHPVKDQINEDFVDALRYYVINRWGVVGLDEDSAGRRSHGPRSDSLPGDGRLFNDPGVYGSVGGPDSW